MVTKQETQTVFRPHFYGSWEARQEKGTCHLIVPTTGPTRALCGVSIPSVEDTTNGERLNIVPEGVMLPRGICKRCKRAVLK
jgi:hypothetical protein